MGFLHRDRNAELKTDNTASKWKVTLKNGTFRKLEQTLVFLYCSCKVFFSFIYTIAYRYKKYNGCIVLVCVFGFVIQIIIIFVEYQHFTPSSIIFICTLYIHTSVSIVGYIHLTDCLGWFSFYVYVLFTVVVVVYSLFSVEVII